jgi:hypothetical protein
MKRQLDDSRNRTYAFDESGRMGALCSPVTIPPAVNPHEKEICREIVEAAVRSAVVLASHQSISPFQYPVLRCVVYYVRQFTICHYLWITQLRSRDAYWEAWRDQEDMLVDLD